MAEYIDREAALKRFEEIKQSGISLKDAIYIDGVMAVIETLLAADVAPVVRCKDCKYSKSPSKLTILYGEPGTLTCCYGPCNRRNVNENDFCSYGAKMEREA